MSDSTSTPGSGAGPFADPSGEAVAQVGYCQECGRGITAATLRRVGNGVFCVTCAAQRQPPAGWQPVNAGGRPGVPPSVSSGLPSPAFAGVLGFIPGVGAMYNGQYAKGAMHLIVFVILVTLADNLNWVFYWLVWGWVFYQVFDAYHTARARRDGLPLPNPFGWNDIGERLGFHRSSPPVPPPVEPAATASRRAGANWAGYVPPAEPVRPAYAEPSSENPYTAPHAEPYVPPGPRPVPPGAPPIPQVPYTPTFTGGFPGQPAAPPPPPRSRSFPLGALWLIGLGLLFLLGNLLPEWRLSARWLVPFLLAALAVWGALRRWEQFRAAPLGAAPGPSLAGAMVGPVMLFTVASLLALQAADLFPMRRSWPVLLVVWGGMLLLQRTSPPPAQVLRVEPPEAPPQAVRSTSGTGSLGL